MAAADDDDVTENLNRIEEEFQCSLCLNRLNNPKILPCFHSFCAECLQSWYLHCPEQAIICPECRLETLCPSGISALKDDFRAKSVIDNLPKLTEVTNEHKTCTSCDYENVAICGCLDCLDLLCRECQFAHRRLKVTRLHTVLACKEFNIQSRLLAIKKATTMSTGLLFTFGGQGNNKGELQSPSCVSYHDKFIHVSDMNGVHTFDQDGQFIKTTPMERLIVCTFLWKPIIWNRQSRILRLLFCSQIVNNDFCNFEIRNIGTKMLNRPWGVAVDSKNLIYVVDKHSGCIFCFEANGEFVKKISCKGQGEGQLLNPTFIAISPTDEISVTDTININITQFKHSVKIFDKKGHFLLQFDLCEPFSQCVMNLHRPIQGSTIAITDRNLIVILDPETKVVQLFTNKGEHIKTVTKFEGLKEPRGVCLIDDNIMDRQLLVSVDKGDHCLKVFKF
ncbi:uncharacterized protein LOC141902455 isoform X2 [Tubulanus polymorphus]|uniref:uncharacterized protein LOC141902455 isoform X2 n=1 Tax=Tubulanus polymorphus TaxID=672921 RepID=UPI003DA2B1CF